MQEEIFFGDKAKESHIQNADNTRFLGKMAEAEKVSVFYPGGCTKFDKIKFLDVRVAGWERIV